MPIEKLNRGVALVDALISGICVLGACFAFSKAAAEVPPDPKRLQVCESGRDTSRVEQLASVEPQ